MSPLELTAADARSLDFADPATAAFDMSVVADVVGIADSACRVSRSLADGASGCPVGWLSPPAGEAPGCRRADGSGALGNAGTTGLSTRGLSGRGDATA